MTIVTFDTEGVNMPDIDTGIITTWLERVAANHGKRLGRLAYRFCNDEYILDANVRFLGHNYYTDIITWDYSNSKRLSGDMLISLDTVASNAALLGVSFLQELHRVIVHGLLHLCGIGDKAPGEREIMEQHENAALDELTCLAWRGNATPH